MGFDPVLIGFALIGTWVNLSFWSSDKSWAREALAVTAWGASAYYYYYYYFIVLCSVYFIVVWVSIWISQYLNWSEDKGLTRISLVFSFPRL